MDRGGTSSGRVDERGLRAPHWRAALLAGTILAGLGAAGPATAQDATWLLNPGTADFNTNTNWTPATVPTGTATFDQSNTTTLTFSAPTAVGTFFFNSGAPAYTFNLSGQTLTLGGLGIANGSSNAPVFNLNGRLNFLNEANAPTAVINNTGGIVDFSGSTGPDGLNVITTGSISGTGVFYLGNNQVSVGGNDASTTVSGAISDCGAGGTLCINSGATGGRLVKDGTGTLTLSGVNTYTGGTIVNNGTLLLSGSGTLGATTAQLQVTGGTLDLGGTSQTTGAMSMFGGSVINGTLNSTTYNLQNGLVSAVLTGGAVTKDGVGTLTLTNVNTYVGGTTVNDGVLVITNGNALSNGAVTMNGGALTAGASVLLANAITFGNAAVSAVTAMTGTTFTLAGTVNFNTLSATTFGSPTDTGTVFVTSGASSAAADAAVVVAGGTLKAGSNQLGAVLGTTQSTAVNAGATLDFNGFTAAIHNLQGAGSVMIGVNPASTLSLTVDNATTTEFSGVISGAGAVNLAGGGTLVLSGDNTYAGTTTINAGLLQLGNGGMAGAIVGDVVNNAIMAINRSNAVTFGGLISGAGAFQQNGVGTTTLTANNTYTGTTTINAGTLFVAGSISSSSGVTANSGATLAGTGVVSSTTINAGGALVPGPTAGTGTLAVQGSLMMNAAAAYIIQISGSISSKTNVTGAASLGGTVQISGSAVPGSYVILTANGGLGGTTFSGVSGSVSGSATNPHLIYDPNNVFLVFDPLALALLLPPGAPGHAVNVANAIDRFIAGGGTLPAAFQTLFGLSPGALADALNQSAGQTGLGADQGVFNALQSFFGAIFDFDGSERAGGGSSNFAAEPALSEAAALAYAAVTPKDRRMPTKAALSDRYDPRWRVWAAGFGGSGELSGSSATGSQDVASRVFGGAAGADYRASRDLTLGLAMSGGETRYSLANGFGSGHSDFVQGALYGRHRFGDAYVAAAVAGGAHRIATDRTVAFAGDRLTAAFTATTIGGRVEGGRRFGSWATGFTPYGAVQVQSVFTPAYTEAAQAGAGSTALRSGARDVTTTRTELGAWGDHRVRTAGGEVMLRARAAWVHNFNRESTVIAGFPALPGTSFLVNGASRPADAALVSAAAEVPLGRNWSASAKFDGEFAAGSSIYTGTGVLRYVW